MVSISKCPRCEQLVSLPEGVDLDALVRCPLCSAEYALRESLPPSLVLVGSSEVIAGGAQSSSDLSAASIAATGAEPSPEAPEQDQPNPDTGVAAIGATEGETSETPETPAVEAAGDEPPAGAPERTDAESTEAPSPEVSETSGESSESAPAAEAPREAEQSATAADGGGSMFDFLHQDGGSSATGVVGGAAGAVSAPEVGGDIPSFAGDSAPNATGEGVPASSIAARTSRRKEKNPLKEMIGAIVGGFIGLSIGYYGLNYFGGDRFDFLQIWLPGVSHTEKHWTDEKTSEDAGHGEAHVTPPDEVYPPDPKPEGALIRAISRYIDANFQRLVMAGKIRPDSSKQLVAVDIGGEKVLTAVDGETIETIEDVQIFGAKLKKGFRLKRQDQWWVELGETTPKPDPDAIAKADPPADVEIDVPPPKEPEPKTKPLPDDYIGPKNRDSYTLAQVGEALKAAHGEFKKLKEHEELGDPLYQRLAQLAERLTFVDTEQEAGLFDRQFAIETLFERLAMRPGRVGEIAAHALAQLDDLDSADGGIVLAGTVGRESEREGLHGTMLAMPGAQNAYNVLSDKPLGLEEGDTVLLAGVAVTNPSENLIGYPGSRPVVIWAATAVRVPQPIDAPDDPPREGPAEESPTDEAPADDPPMDAPADDDPAEEEPADKAPMEDAPADDEPAENADEPMQDALADDEPADDEPADDEPADDAPAEDVRAENTDEPLQEAPADDTPADGEPAADDAPADDAPADDAPADDAPTEEAPDEG